MDRRSFLRGSLLSLGAGTALVKLATPEQTQALIATEPVVLGQPGRLQLPYFSGDMIVYLSRETPHRKEYVPIGYLTSFSLHTDVIEAGTAWDGSITLVPGLRRGEATFEGSS